MNKVLLYCHAFGFLVKEDNIWIKYNEDRSWYASVQMFEKGITVLEYE